MDTLLHTPTSMAKRACPFSSTNASSRLPGMSYHVDGLLHTFLSLADSPSLCIDLPLERLLEVSPCDADQSVLIDRALKLGTMLLEAGKRSARKRSTKHNFIAWALPPDLTIKVFSLLDTQSLCHAAATCTMFQKCAMDPFCYANVDLTAVVPKINNGVVSTMIQRAGKALWSLKLGIVPGPIVSRGSCQPLVYGIRNSIDVSNFSWNEKKTRQGKESYILTRSCLNPLSGDGVSSGAGTLLRRLHLYNIERIDNSALCTALSACPSLLDLEIVGLHVELRQTLESVSMSCPLIERLFFESSKTGRDDSLKSTTCVDLVNNCPNLTSLALRGFKLQDCKVRVLVKGFQRLKYADFSSSYSITGSFLRNLGGAIGGSLLEVLILRDCMHMKETEVGRLMAAILAGDFKLLQHLDVSNREGLASSGDWYRRCYDSRYYFFCLEYHGGGLFFSGINRVTFICILYSIFPIKPVLEARPNMCLLAEFPSEDSFIDIEQIIVSEPNSDISLPSQLGSHISDGSYMSTSESSYNSDQSSGNEEGHDPGYLVFEESSDEFDFLVI